MSGLFVIANPLFFKLCVEKGAGMQDAEAVKQGDKDHENTKYFLLGVQYLS